MRITDKVDVIIVGAGPSGTACACALAKNGLEVLVIERGEYPGAKNIFGGIFFSSVIEKLFPEFIKEAPWERYVGKRRFSLLAGDSEMALEMKPSAFNRPPFNHSFIAKRSRIDRWFGEEAEKLGVNIICNYNVKDFLYERGRVVGITSGGDQDSLLADVVVCAEGANALLSQKAGLRADIPAEVRSIAVKEVIQLSPGVIEERFGLSNRQGAAYEYFGSSVQGLLGNGFIYTNNDSLSVGVGFSISDFLKKKDGKTPNDILEDFKSHPAVKPLVKDGETVEYMAHMIPSDSFWHLPKIYRDGLLLVGDAAGFLNTSFFHEGVNLAMASGLAAAETITEAKKENDFTSRMLSAYREKLDNSFVMQDLKNCKNFLSFLRTHKSITNDYPHLLNEILVDYFHVSEKPKDVIKKEIFHKVRENVRLRCLTRDLWGAWNNLL